MSMPRVAITGLGALSPLGLTAKEMWEHLASGKCGITSIKAFETTNFPCQYAGQVPEFKPQQYVPKSYRKAVKLMCRDIQLAVGAAKEAVQSSGLITKGIDENNINIDPTRMAIDLGAGIISCELPELGPAIAKSITDGKFDIRKWGKEGLEAVTPLWLLKYLPNMLACHIGIIHDIQGPSNTITCAEAAAHIAIGEADRLIQRGWADVALAGGAEAKVNPIVMIRQCLLKRARTENHTPPESACKPFDADAKGSVFGEGAGIIVLEKLEHAQKRGAKILGELVGAGESNNINPVYEKLEQDAKGLQIAIQKALAEAQITPEDLDLIIPHGLGIPADDLAEARAIQNALGPAAAKIPTWPTKSMLSATGAASGALDVIAAVCAIAEGKIPAAKNCENKAASCELNITGEPQQKDIRYVLCCSYTYGSQTAALVLKKIDE
jgi:3-oxoacyl-[acyl-carrier-protein] synthase II